MSTTPASPPARRDDLELATRMATETAPLAMKWFSSVDLTVRTKSDGSPVTQADVEVEQALRAIVADVDPTAGVLGEEEGESEGTSERSWIFDPIDGTTAFAHGVPLFSTLIALHDEHGPAVGVISLPGLDEIVVAGRGLGAFRNGEPCRVSTQADVDRSLITTWGYNPWPPSLVGRLAGAGAELRGWSDGYGWALLATGRVDAVIDFGVKPWDLAPVQVILPEAGGRFSAFDGSDDIGRGTGLGTNGLLHDRLREVLAEEGLAG